MKLLKIDVDDTKQLLDKFLNHLQNFVIKIFYQRNFSIMNIE